MGAGKGTRWVPLQGYTPSCTMGGGMPGDSGLPSTPSSRCHIIVHTRDASCKAGGVLQGWWSNQANSSQADASRSTAHAGKHIAHGQRMHAWRASPPAQACSHSGGMRWSLVQLLLKAAQGGCDHGAVLLQPASRARSASQRDSCPFLCACVRVVPLQGGCDC